MPVCIQTLLAKDPLVRFAVGPEATGGAVTINMPYWSFYHTAKLNLTSSSADHLYFPIKRAANNNQYILGQTFLQSAYVSVDYHHQTFTLSQALYPSSSTKQKVEPINLSPKKKNAMGWGQRWQRR